MAILLTLDMYNLDDSVRMRGRTGWQELNEGNWTGRIEHVQEDGWKGIIAARDHGHRMPRHRP